MPNAMNLKLPKFVDPYKLAEQHTVLEGEVSTGVLSRFRGAIMGLEDDAVCSVRLFFWMDPERRRVVSGELSAPVQLQCQRCMGSMQVTLRSHFELGLVTSDEQAQRLPQNLEPFLTEDFNANLWLMVEDELLLVLPPFPLHERDECPAREDLEALEPGSNAEKPVGKSAENPFSVLAGLKNTKH
jgi:uncharacterized protein